MKKTFIFNLVCMLICTGLILPTAGTIVMNTPSEKPTSLRTVGVHPSNERSIIPLFVNENWMKTFGGWRYDVGISTQQTADGGYIIVGITASKGAGKDDVWLIKTDSMGAKIWEKTFGGPDIDIGVSVQQTTDEGYIITGRTRSYGNGLDDVWLIKTNNLGIKEWEKTFGGTLHDGGSQVRQTNDGGYIIVGDVNNDGGGDGDLWIIKTDGTGTMQWEKIYDGHGSPLSHDSGSSIALCSDGDYIIAGGTFTRTDTYGYNIWLIKIDEEGNHLWNETFGGSDSEFVSSVIQTNDGGYLMVGVDSYTNPDETVWIIKTDENGEFQWEQKYAGMGTARGESVQQTSDGGFIIAGFTYRKFSRYKALIVKTDENGAKQWSKIFFGGVGNSIASSVQQTTDGGYIIGGERSLFLNSNVWLIKYYPR
ncbi:MAG: hypothetical protein H6P94_809 [Thermoplasmatales archaeon]|nr:hypothetical protein [Thermoplasmatales archaeon]